MASALRQLGATVSVLSGVGDGVPDLLVGFRGATFLLEVKDGSLPPSKQKLTPAEEKWHAEWRGGPKAVVASLDEALRVMGVT